MTTPTMDKPSAQAPAAAASRQSKKDTVARRLTAGGAEERVPAAELRRGDRVVVEAGETIPGDGDVVEGIASVDESAITGESRR
jgi:K+-transporting ATPase ATPase B chain